MNSSTFYGKRFRNSIVINENGGGNSDEPQITLNEKSGEKKQFEKNTVMNQSSESDSDEPLIRLKQKNDQGKPGTSRKLEKKENKQYFFSDESEASEIDDSDLDPHYSDGNEENDTSEKSDNSDGQNESSDTENIDPNSQVMAVQSVWNKVGQTMISFAEYEKDAEMLVDVDLSKPYQLYKLFLTDDITDLMVTETNRYAQQCLSSATGNKRTPKKRKADWKPTTNSEMRDFWQFY